MANCLAALLFHPRQAGAGTLAQFQTALGSWEIELFDQAKPLTVQNFIRLAREGQYQGSFIHRWAPGFVIQGGGFSVTNRFSTNRDPQFIVVAHFGAVSNEFQVEPRLSNLFGTIAMAKTSNPDSATSQWFINLGDNSASLDNTNNSGGFTVFGRLLSGTNTLDQFVRLSPQLRLIDIGVPFNALPVLNTGADATFNDLLYVNVSLLTVQVKAAPEGLIEISWNSIQNRPHLVEFSANHPPVWELLARTNGTGSQMRVVESTRRSAQTFYRVRVEY